MTKLMTKRQPGQDELAQPARRTASRADASAAHNDAPHVAKPDKGGQTTRPTLGGAYAAYTSSAPVASRGAHAHVAPPSVAPTWPTLPGAPTRLEASLTTVGDLARRYPSVAAFVPVGLPALAEPALAPIPARTKPAKAPKTTHAASASAPTQPATGVRQRFAELRAALAEGWEIVQPIFARPLWSVADDSATAFNFVLSRAQATRLVTVPEGRTVSRFIHDQALMVDYRR